MSISTIEMKVNNINFDVLNTPNRIVNSMNVFTIMLYILLIMFLLLELTPMTPWLRDIDIITYTSESYTTHILIYILCLCSTSITCGMMYVYATSLVFIKEKIATITEGCTDYEKYAVAIEWHKRLQNCIGLKDTDFSKLNASQIYKKCIHGLISKNGLYFAIGQFVIVCCMMTFIYSTYENRVAQLIAQLGISRQDFTDVLSAGYTYNIKTFKLETTRSAKLQSDIHKLEQFKPQ